ncbi:HAD-IA family hydrolase [Streptomyces cacaoi]
MQPAAPQPVRPQAVVFDVLETLMDLAPMSARFAQVGFTGLLRPWFLRLQRDCMALALSGDSPDFRTAARQALRVETEQRASEDALDHVLEGFEGLPAHPDAQEALRTLDEAGVRVGCLSVGEEATVRAFLERAELAPYVRELVTAADTGTWKPAPEVYRVAAERMGTSAARTALVAVHAWDCHGAKRAGWTAGWCARLEGRHGAELFVRPDVTGRDLPEVAAGLLALPGSPGEAGAVNAPGAP